MCSALVILNIIRVMIITACLKEQGCWVKTPSVAFLFSLKCIFLLEFY